MKTLKQFLKEDNELSKIDFVAFKVVACFGRNAKLLKTDPRGKELNFHISNGKISISSYSDLLKIPNFIKIGIIENSELLYYNRTEVQRMVKDSQELEFDKIKEIIVTIR